MTPFDFLKIVLAVWYVAYAVTSTHGPLGVFHWMREHLPHGRRGMRSERIVITDGAIEPSLQIPKENGLFDCIICLTVWVSFLLLLVPTGIVIDALAVAGAALMLHSFTGWKYE